MPAHSDLSTALDRQLLLQLGRRLKLARAERGLTATELARHVGISRTTLAAVEAGDPNPTMGTYLRVMSALGMSQSLALLAADTPLPVRASKPRKKSTAGFNAPDDTGVAHASQDLQSLMLHKEAVRLMHERPELIDRALETLEKWRSTGAERNRVLWDEWSVLLHRRQWRRILSHTQHSQQLRQASPLPTVLPAGVREDVLAQMKALKKSANETRKAQIA